MDVVMTVLRYVGHHCRRRLPRHLNPEAVHKRHRLGEDIAVVRQKFRRKIGELR